MSTQIITEQYDTVWRPRGEVRRAKRRADGVYAQSYGMRIGYWPCLHAPFVSFYIGSRVFEGWLGWGSYR